MIFRILIVAAVIACNTVGGEDVLHRSLQETDAPVSSEAPVSSGAPVSSEAPVASVAPATAVPKPLGGKPMKGGKPKGAGKPAKKVRKNKGGMTN